MNQLNAQYTESILRYRDTGIVKYSTCLYRDNVKEELGTLFSQIYKKRKFRRRGGSPRKGIFPVIYPENSMSLLGTFLQFQGATIKFKR